jgi:serine/threonine protein kinase
LDIFKYLHSQHIIHRDVKPENLLFGHPDGNRANKLHLIDFGLAAYYRDPVSKLHRSLQEKQKMVGTMHYTSSNVLQGISTYHNHSAMMRLDFHIGGYLGPSRRDDLVSLAYTFLWILRAKLPWDHCSKSAAKEMKATMTGSVLFSGLPEEFAEFYDYVRGLEYDEDPDYDRWQGIFNDLLDPYVLADESFEFASAWDFEDMDDDLIDGPDDWPEFSKCNSVPDDDDDDEDCGSYRRHTGFMPYKSWPNPAGVKEADLFGDEDELLKGRVDIIPAPPSVLEGGYVSTVNADYEEMLMI